MDNLTSKIYLVVIGLFVTLAVSAQQITGVVKDTGGQPLTGVSVFVDGTTTGASTDMDGKYAIDVDNAHGKTLIFSFIGMRTQEVRIGSSLVYDVIMEEDANFLEETVVIGYATVKRKDLIGSVSSVDSKALAAIVPAAIVMLLFAIIAAATGSFSYSGLSIDLLYRAIDGRGVPLYAFMLKAVLVFLSIAAGFVGGEVVPLLVTGSTFGFAFASVFGLETGPYAVLGAIGMLTGGTNLPLVCFALGLELFGYGEPALLFMTVAIAYLSSGNSGIYHHQRIAMQNRIVR